MFLPSDPTYRRAKSAKLGETSIDTAYADFVLQFERRFHLSPLWLETNTIPGPGVPDEVRPRLDVILERTREYQTFLKAPFNFDSRQQARVARMFLDQTTEATRADAFRPPRHKRLRGDLFVCFSDFEKVAKHEVHDSVTAAELEAFAANLGFGEQFWCTRRFSGPPTVFVYTEEQARTLRSSDRQTAWADRYFEIAKLHNEFGYLERSEIVILVDSKENFDTNYDSNWYYYFK